MSVSTEEKVEDYYKRILSDLGIRYYGKTESMNASIDKALKEAESKSGGNGSNRPDIKFMLDNGMGRRVPTVVEAKGNNSKLEKLDSDGSIQQSVLKKGNMDYSAVKNYAVNGALHYGLAILSESSYDEVIIVGISASTLNEGGVPTDTQIKAYYVSSKNNQFPKLIVDIDIKSVLFAPKNTDKLFSILDNMSLTEAEREQIKKQTENTLEKRVKEIHQRLYDDKSMEFLGTNDKLYLFCGLIMAGLPVKGLAPLTADSFQGNDDKEENDGKVICDRVKTFLKRKNCTEDKVEKVTSLIHDVFSRRELWGAKTPNDSILKSLFLQVQSEIIPCLCSDLRLDFTGRILNSLNDWVRVENDQKNDVVLTPRYVTKFMAQLARTNMDSYVWDRAMGSGGFLVSALDIMLRDAEDHIKDKDELEAKKEHIKTQQIFGVEILGNIYILAVLNMILMGDGSSNILCGNSHGHYISNGEFSPSGDKSEEKEEKEEYDEYWGFPATVFLLNPPYSAPGKGLNFVAETLDTMTKGCACILIQENAGAGQATEYAQKILKNNTLRASIHMPADLMKASVQTAIYLFEVARPHEKDDMVKFIDMSEDGYKRSNRKKSTQEKNCRDVDHADDRYAEVIARVLDKAPKTEYYTEENGLYFTDTIAVGGEDFGKDWTVAQHRKIDIVPTEADFEKTVSDYLAWKVGQILKGEQS